MPSLVRVARRIEWFTVSNAADRSRRMRTDERAEALYMACKTSVERENKFARVDKASGWGFEYSKYIKIHIRRERNRPPYCAVPTPHPDQNKSMYIHRWPHIICYFSLLGWWDCSCSLASTIFSFSFSSILWGLMRPHEGHKAAVGLCPRTHYNTINVWLY